MAMESHGHVSFLAMRRELGERHRRCVNPAASASASTRVTNARSAAVAFARRLRLLPVRRR